MTFEVSPYLLTTEFKEKMMLEGQPFLLQITHAAASGINYANRTTFTLDTSTYDYVGDGTSTGRIPCLGKSFFITGIRAICQAGTTLGALAIDNRVVINTAYLNNGVGNDIWFDGLPQATDAATRQNAPSMSKGVGSYAITCRASIWVYPSAIGGGETMRVFFIGHLMDRKY